MYRLIGTNGQQYLSSTPGRLGGHRRTKVFGRLDCPAALRAIAKGGYKQNRVFFADEATARAAGYRPCGSCLPELFREWKASQSENCESNSGNTQRHAKSNQESLTMEASQPPEESTEHQIP